MHSSERSALHRGCQNLVDSASEESWGGGLGLGGQKCRKNAPPPPSFLVSEIINLFGFSDFEPKNCFRVPTPWGLEGVEWEER